METGGPIKGEEGVKEVSLVESDTLDEQLSF